MEILTEAARLLHYKKMAPISFTIIPYVVHVNVFKLFKKTYMACFNSKQTYCANQESNEKEKEL